MFIFHATFNFATTSLGLGTIQSLLKFDVSTCKYDG